ncbi:LPS-assembly protein LptD [Chelatococcus sp. SYSU_G07232]|uniref:LPS-assembly protein LptD n=1 Tax=Chelatococcus albus TaxID=3047466 RepID=A0ABT7AL36_9HYPH|nr:LPS-assembly protein LptD [Chelatococcus sp. SYSU_G07232]MDJ1159682.1 LPS-assembly protein LptD [Chelatococcus sp. SYSU_G07232]
MAFGLGTVARLAFATALATLVVPLPASAQTVSERLAAQAQGNKDDKLLVEAREIVYNTDKNTVSAVGDVHLYYQGRTLEADKVTYDRNSKRVFAEGNARLTEKDGTVATGDRFELTDDFKDGFIESLRVQQSTVADGFPVTTRFSAPRAERTSGETTVFDKGTYTACESCKKDPGRPPLWQVKAARIIHDNNERMIYYEDATLEFWGLPVAYMPYFSMPDPTVKRKTGVLAPRFRYSKALGVGVGVPIFWNIAPNYDLTFTPMGLSRQGFLGEVEWRHRLMNGSYNIRAAGIFQQDKNAFLAPPYGAQNKDFRGSIETTGRFAINPQWNWGWDVAFLSDKWFLQNYKIRSESLSSTYFRESTSTVYLTGQSETAFFDLRGYYIRTLSYQDWQKQQPIVHPTLDYNKRIQTPGSIGGELQVDVNVTSLSRDAAQYQGLGTNVATIGGVYPTCNTFNPSSCFVRGIGGNYTRASASASWRRSFIDPLGQVWMPFAGLRADGFFQDINTTRYQNAQIANFIDPDTDTSARFMPTIGVEYRYPLIAATNGFGMHTVEPIAQLIARPTETRIGRLPNEDAQSLVFDDTNLFEWNKFSGYDRVEGGVRANVGVKYAVTTDTGGYSDLLFGQSYQLAGRNSFAAGDLANTGLNSGLETTRSDYVARLHVAPNSNLSFTGRGRFDERTFNMRRIELQTNVTLGPVTTSAIYARYDAQPELGIDRRREGLYTSAGLRLTPNWSLNGSVLFDLDRYLQDRLTNPTGARSTPWSVAGLSLGVLYQDECTVFGITYSSSYKDAATGTKDRDTTVMLRLELRTLGEINISQNLSGGGSQDGISQ